MPAALQLSRRVYVHVYCGEHKTLSIGLVESRTTLAHASQQVLRAEIDVIATHDNNCDSNVPVPCDEEHCMCLCMWHSVNNSRMRSEWISASLLKT